MTSTHYLLGASLLEKSICSQSGAETAALQGTHRTPREEPQDGSLVRGAGGPSRELVWLSPSRVCKTPPIHCTQDICWMPGTCTDAHSTENALEGLVGRQFMGGDEMCLESELRELGVVVDLLPAGHRFKGRL